jgi:hypothetical protein
MGIDSSRAILKGPDHFLRFNVPEHGEALASLGLPEDKMLLVIERRGEQRAFLLEQMAYHHLAQGTLAGEPYLVSF